jgi:hypothetical protein
MPTLLPHSALVLYILEKPAGDTPQREDERCPCEEHHSSVQRRRPVHAVRVGHGAADGAQGVAEGAEGGDQAVQSAWGGRGGVGVAGARLGVDEWVSGVDSGR